MNFILGFVIEFFGFLENFRRFNLSSRHIQTKEKESYLENDDVLLIFYLQLQIRVLVKKSFVAEFRECFFKAA